LLLAGALLFESELVIFVPGKLSAVLPAVGSSCRNFQQLAAPGGTSKLLEILFICTLSLRSPVDYALLHLLLLAGGKHSAPSRTTFR
jgi:hypothetical protein